MIIWNDYNKYDFDLGLDDRTLGDLRRSGYKLPQYPFYSDGYKDPQIAKKLKSDFERKFYLHFKYNKIAFTKTTIFSDMFQDIMELNYPKYKHYFDVLQKTAELKWWNNKDFLVTLDRFIDSTNSSNFTSMLDTMDKFTSNMIRTGDITNDFMRNLNSSNNETNSGTNTTTLARQGEDTLTFTKQGTVDNRFKRDLKSTELQHNTDGKLTVTDRSDEGSNDTETRINDSKKSNTTSKTLDTPQGTINNLLSNPDAYMTSGTVDGSTDITNTDTLVNSSTKNTSKDTTQTNGNDDRDIKGTETGYTENTETFDTTDTTTDRKATTDTTTEQLGATKKNDIIEKGFTQNTEKRNTKDALAGQKDGKQSEDKAGFEEGHDRERFTRTEEGNIGVTSAGQLVEDWLKKGYINLDKMIIRDCEELFLQVY